MTSPVYWHPWIYSLAMRLLYGRGGQDRLSAIGAVVPAGSDVFEACAGDGRLFRRALAGKRVTYAGGDTNGRFVAHARRRGIAVNLLDVRHDALPRADFVIIQASLYQFIPHHAAVVARLAASARRTLIIAEPVRNLAASKNRVVAWLGRRGAATAVGGHPSRFDEASLDSFIRASFPGRAIASSFIAGGRERLYCIDVAASQAADAT